MRVSFCINITYKQLICNINLSLFFLTLLWTSGGEKAKLFIPQRSRSVVRLFLALAALLLPGTQLAGKTALPRKDKKARNMKRCLRIYALYSISKNDSFAASYAYHF